MIENNNTQNITLWISRTKRITKRSLQQRIRAQVAERATRRQAVVFRENTADVHHVHVYTPDSVPLSIASVLHTTVATMTRQDSVPKVSEQDCRVVSPVSHKPNMVNSHAVNSVSPVSRDTVPVPIIMAVATSPVSRDMDSKATVPAIRRVKRVATSLVSSRVAMATINSRGGYQPRQGQGEYGQQSRGGYGYNSNRGGGYQSRQQGGRPGNRPYGKGGYGNAPYGSKKSYGKRPRTADYDPNAKYSLKKRIEYKEVNYDPNEPVRLNKYLANAGVCSRREADEFIQAGVVTVNGQVVTELGTKILRTDEVKFHDEPVTLEKKVYVLLNKPKDYVTTSDDPQQRKTVMDLVKNACPERIYPVGRLDRNTTGVLLLTNDGDLASKLTHPKYLKKKIYHVYLDKNVTAHDLQAIAEGIQLEDGEIKADDVQYADAVDKKQVGIEIHSGKNRIVRRIFESLGYKVLKLDRVQFAGLTKKNLRRGDWRYLTEEEVDRLRMGAYE